MLSCISKKSWFALILLSGCAVSDLPEPAVTQEIAAQEIAPPAPPARFPDVPARALPLPAPQGRPIRLYLDAGHGAPGNRGNTSCFGQQEQDFTRRLALEIAPLLEATGLVTVEVSAAGSGYNDRIARAEAGSEVLVSLHSDVRGIGYPWPICPGVQCYWNLNDPGFALLWADEAPAGSRLPAARERLAGALAGQMALAGFPAAAGLDYGGLYERTAEGVFLDRHEPQKRIRMLRRPSIPSVIVETHHAWYPGEAARWEQPDTRAAFAAALARGLAAWRGAALPAISDPAQSPGSPAR